MSCSSGCVRGKAMSGALFVVCCLALSSAKAAPPPAVTVASLLARFHQVKGLEARFREEKRMALLKAPLVSEGTIHFAAPDRLARHTTSPVESILLIDAKDLRFGDANHSESLPIDSSPALRLFVDSFLKILTGDRAGLEKLFVIQLEASGESWKMRLKPRVEPMTGILDALVLEGNGLILHRMVLAESSGDSTTTVFTKVELDRSHAPDELEKIFRMPSRQE